MDEVSLKWNKIKLKFSSLKHFPEDDEEEPPELMTGLGSSVQLLELPLGYGYYSFGYYGNAQNPSESVDGSLNSEDGGSGRGRNNNEINGGGGPPLTYTTCYSPVSSSIQESSSANSGKTSNSSNEHSSTLSSFYLSPYSTVLAITIAIGKWTKIFLQLILK